MAENITTFSLNLLEPSGSVQACNGIVSVGRVVQLLQQLATSWTVPVEAEIFHTCPNRPWCLTNLLYNGYRVFPGGKVRPGRDADPSLPSIAVVKKEQSYTSTPPIGRTACTEPQCLYSTAIPLLPLLAVRPVQSLSAWTVQLYLYSPCGPYPLYRASVPVQYSYTSTPPVGRTPCTEPQCLYNGALYLYLF